MRILRWGLVIVLLMGLDVHAQVRKVGASAHIGTLGVGARVATPLTSRINLKGGIDIVPFEFTVEEEEVDFDVKLPSPTVSILLDFHPGSGGLRLSVGALWFGNEPGIEGIPTESVEYGDNVYTPAEVGTVRGSLGTSRLAPYLGLGWGNALGAGIGFTFDLGMAFHGKPDFNFEATGIASSDPQFQADLREEADQINEDMPGIVSIYPMLSLGFSFGF